MATIAIAVIAALGVISTPVLKTVSAQGGLLFDSTIVAAIITGGFSILAVVLGIVIKSNRGIKSKVEGVDSKVTGLQEDMAKMKRRIYGELWRLMRPLTRYSSQTITYATLEELLDDLTDWFHGESGFFMSFSKAADTQKAFAELKMEIEMEINKAKQDLHKQDLRTPVPHEILERIRKKAETLRQSTIDDVAA
jgi:hypothetical protein